MRTLLAVTVLAAFATSTHADTQAFRPIAKQCLPTGTGPIFGDPIACSDIPSPVDIPGPIELRYPAR